LLPDLDLTVDEWSDRFMVIPKSSGSNEYGKYRTSRTPHAREVMNVLSDEHPCKEVVCMVASQMFKTQVGLNWFASTVHQSPSNFLWLMPTGKLQKRIASRIDKVVKDVDVLSERVAKPHSRDAMNNQDIKEYIGGSLLIATAGSAANLSEVPIRRVIIDEIDRCEDDVDGEGDPKKLTDNRQTTFEHNRKSYFPSSPTHEGKSKVNDLFNQGTKRHALAECVHCGHVQELIFENLIVSENDEALYPCCECGGIHKEADKTKMFKKGLWSDGVKCDGTVESFTASAMYLPYGWKPWRGLMRDYDEAKQLLENGDESEMIVFYNTRLARCWERKKEQPKYEALMARAEPYQLREVQEGGVYVTAAIDTQDDRLEYKAVAWGEGMERWIIDYRVLYGSPANESLWQQMDDLLKVKYKHVCGVYLPLSAAFIDSGGHYTQEVYNFVRGKHRRNIYAIKGESRPGKPILGNRTSVDLNYLGRTIKKGVYLWHLGTDTAKDHLLINWDKAEGSNATHFSHELEENYYKQLTAEYRVTKKYRGKKVSGWEKKDRDRNEAIDLMVYNLAAAHYLGLYDYSAKEWERRKRLVLGDRSKSSNTGEKEPHQNTENRNQPVNLSRGRNLMKNLRGRINGRNR